MTDKIDVLFIRSKLKPGFRRAGFYFPHEGAAFSPDSFTEEQLAMIEAEPQLTIQEGEMADLPPVITDSVADLGNDLTLEDLVEFIATLNPDDSSLWNRDGSPKASSFTVETTAEQRTAAWKLFKANQGK